MSSKLTSYCIGFLFFFLLIGIAECSFSQTIRGKVEDARTGEPMVGATVYLENTRYSTIVNMDGSFFLKHIPAGKYELVVSSIGYDKSKEMDIDLSSAGEVRNLASIACCSSRAPLKIISRPEMP